MLRRVCDFPEGFSSVGKFKPQGIKDSPSYKNKEKEGEQIETDKTTAATTVHPAGCPTARLSDEVDREMKNH